MNRQTTAFNTLAISVIAALLLIPVFILGQGPGTATKSQPAAAQTAKAPAPATKAWVTPRTPDGQPDLQGYWTNATYNQLERAAGNADKLFYTKEEFDERVRRAALQDEQQTTPGTTGDVHYDFTQFGLDKSQNTFAMDLRNGMITDPPDGRIPAQTAEARKRTADRAAAYRYTGGGAQGDSVQTIVIGSRCIIYNPPPGPPMLPQGYNGNYQIIQSRDSVMILFEQIGDIRIIYLDGRPAPPPNIRLTLGASRGHWEGDTLVVETTNLSDRPQARNAVLSGVSDNFKLIERFKRTGENTFDYEFTVNDPATFAKPWTASMPFNRIKGPIFEAACHEGNYGIEDTLKGYRALDNQPAAAATPAAPRGAGGGARRRTRTWKSRSAKRPIGGISMKLKIAIFTSFALTLASVPLWAHHAFAAEFDVNKPLKLKGTLKKWEMINPHSWFHIEEKRPDGKVVQWMVEGGSPSALIREGVTKETVPIGTLLIIDAYLAKSGDNKAVGRDFTLPDGKRLFLGGSAQNIDGKGNNN